MHKFEEYQRARKWRKMRDGHGVTLALLALTITAFILIV